MHRGNTDDHSVPVVGRAVKICPPDRLPLEGETIFARSTERTVSDYCIDPVTGCWNWNKSLLRGYAVGSTGRMHRIYYKRKFGIDAIPDGWDLHHECENPKCINPDHMEPRPHDLHTGGHFRRRKRTLTWDQAREIRARAQADHTLSYPKLAEEYGCSRGLVQDIVECVAFREPGIEWRKPERDCEFCGTPIPQEKPRHARYCDPVCRRKANSRASRKARDIAA